VNEELLVHRLVLAREQADGDLAPRAVEGLAQKPAALVGEADDSPPDKLAGAATSER